MMYYEKLKLLLLFLLIIVCISPLSNSNNVYVIMHMCWYSIYNSVVVYDAVMVSGSRHANVLAFSTVTIPVVEVAVIRHRRGWCSVRCVHICTILCGVRK